MKASDFDYDLPLELIAQEPPERRDGARMMVLDRAARTIGHRAFADLPAYLRPRDLLRGRLRNLPALESHLVLFDVLRGHGPEGADADVERDGGLADALRGEAAEHLGREVQSGGGRGHGAGLARKHGLVAQLVCRAPLGRGFFALDVGRQRRLPDAVEHLQPRHLRFHAHLHAA